LIPQLPREQEETLSFSINALRDKILYLEKTTPGSMTTVFAHVVWELVLQLMQNDKRYRTITKFMGALSQINISLADLGDPYRD
jgi:hypothetical protein